MRPVIATCHGSVRGTLGPAGIACVKNILYARRADRTAALRTAAPADGMGRRT